MNSKVSKEKVELRKVIFVDDEKRVLDGLRRMLHPMRNEWQVFFATSGKEALSIMQKKEMDIIVSDARMPEMSGAELLTRVKNKYPRMVRLILSGYMDRENVIQMMGLAHQYLSKPCKSATLRDVLRRSLTLRKIISNETLLPMLTKLESLPSMPTVYSEMLEALDSADRSIPAIAEIIGKDGGMTLRILKIVNSAYFGLRRRITELPEAIIFLGLDAVKSLVLSVQVFSQFRLSQREAQLATRLWGHSLRVAALSKKIAEKENFDRQLIEESFISGLFHDIGTLIIASSMPDKYNTAIKLSRVKRIRKIDAEQEILETSSPWIGAYLLGLWGFSDNVIEAVNFHHKPSECTEPRHSPLTAVHVANELMYARGERGKVDLSKTRLDYKFLDKINKRDRMPEWLDLMILQKMRDKQKE